MGWDLNPSWSLDDKSILFSAEPDFPKDFDDEIFIMDVNGGNRVGLTFSPESDINPDMFDPAFAYSVSNVGKLNSLWGKIRAKVSSSN